MRRSESFRLLAAMFVVVQLAACGNSVSFRLCDSDGAPRHRGSLNLNSGEVEVSTGTILYAGQLADSGRPGSYLGRAMEGKLVGSDGSELHCAIRVQENETGDGTCTGKVTYRVKLRDFPHM